MTELQIQPKTKPTNPQRTTPEALSRGLCKTEETTREDDHRRTPMYLSAMPTANSILSTHLGITIRWSAAPPGYLTVVVGGAAVIFHASGGAGERPAACQAPAGRGGGVSC
jgi:hypothetical protein